MKAILIDELLKDTSTSTEVIININEQEYSGWQIAKPLNYDSKYTTIGDRFKMALKVMQGKAIAVQYFDDLTDEEQREYVTEQLNSDVNS